MALDPFASIGTIGYRLQAMSCGIVACRLNKACSYTPILQRGGYNGVDNIHPPRLSAILNPSGEALLGESEATLLLIVDNLFHNFQ